MDQDQEQRNKKGQFVKGHKGGGRLGTATDQTALGILRSSSAELAQKVIELALGGDTSMLKLCMDKLLPQSSLVQQQLREQIALLEQNYADQDTST